jgi:hypothetical protein
VSTDIELRVRFRGEERLLRLGVDGGEWYAGLCKLGPDWLTGECTPPSHPGTWLPALEIDDFKLRIERPSGNVESIALTRLQAAGPTSAEGPWLVVAARGIAADYNDNIGNRPGRRPPADRKTEGPAVLAEAEAEPRPAHGTLCDELSDQLFGSPRQLPGAPSGHSPPLPHAQPQPGGAEQSHHPPSQPATSSVVAPFVQALLRDIHALTSRLFVYEDPWHGFVPTDGALSEWQIGPPVPFAALARKDKADVLDGFISWEYFFGLGLDRRDQDTILGNVMNGKPRHRWLEGTTLLERSHEGDHRGQLCAKLFGSHRQDSNSDRDDGSELEPPRHPPGRER